MRINVSQVLEDHIKAVATATQAIEAAAFVMRNSSGKQSTFRDRNEFLDNCLGCAESFYYNIDPDFSLGKESRNFILASLGFDSFKGNYLFPQKARR